MARRYSTLESAQKGELSILALVETLITISTAIAVAIYFDTLRHVLYGALLAPLSLLRSDKSVTLGIKWYSAIVERMERWFGKPPDEADDAIFVDIIGVIGNGFRALFFYPALILASLLVRIAATACHPILGLRALTTNWSRSIFCIDVMAPPEAVPGYTRLPIPDNFAQNFRKESFLGLFGALSGFMLLTITQEAFEAGLITGAGAIAGAVICITYAIHVATGLVYILCAYLYRLSLKSTALLWAPLLYVCRDTFSDSLPTEVRLEEMRTGAWWKVKRGLASFTILTLSFKIILLPAIVEWWNGLNLARVLNVYLMPGKIHPWHLAAGLNAGIALGFYFFVLDRATTRLRFGVWTADHVDSRLRAFVFVQWILGGYTIFVAILLTWRTVVTMPLPMFVMSFLP